MGTAKPRSRAAPVITGSKILRLCRILSMGVRVPLKLQLAIARPLFARLPSDVVAAGLCLLNPGKLRGSSRLNASRKHKHLSVSPQHPSLIRHAEARREGVAHAPLSDWQTRRIGVRPATLRPPRLITVGGSRRIAN